MQKKKRITSQALSMRALNKRLAHRRQVEVRYRVYHDQYDLLREWSEETGHSIAAIHKALVELFLNMTESTRLKTMRIK